MNNMNTLMFDINNAVTEGEKRTCNKGMGSWQEKRINYIYTHTCVTPVFLKGIIVLACFSVSPLFSLC